MSLAEINHCLDSTGEKQEHSPSLVVKTTKQQLAQRLAVFCVSLLLISFMSCIYEGLMSFSLFALRNAAWIAFLTGSCLLVLASARDFGDRLVQLSVMPIAVLNGAYWYFASVGTFGTSAAATVSMLGYGLMPGIAVLGLIGRTFHDGNPSISLGATLVLVGLSMGNVYLLSVAYASV